MAGIDIISDSTGKEIVAAIQSTDVAQARILEINTAAESKKNEVLESIPEDYTNLNNDVAELKGDIGISFETLFSDSKTLDIKDIVNDLSTITADIPEGWCALWTRNLYPPNNYRRINTLTIFSPKGGSVALMLATQNVDNTATILKSEDFNVEIGLNTIKLKNWTINKAHNEVLILKANNVGAYGFSSTDTGNTLRYFPTNNQFGATPVFASYDVSLTELSVKEKISNLIIVSKDNASDYNSISEAVKNANDGDVIYIKNGIYNNEIIEAWGKNITIIGENKYKTIIENTTGTYSTPALEMSIGLLKNVTVYAKNNGIVSKDSNGWSDYAVHVENDSLFNNTLTFDNVIMKSDEQSAFGMGTRGNSTIELLNCEFYSDTTFPIWLHDTVSEQMAGNTTVKFKNCIAYTKNGDRIMRVGSQRVKGQSTNLIFVNNVFSTQNGKNEIYKTIDYNTGSETEDTGNFGLIGYNKMILSYGNNISELNY